MRRRLGESTEVLNIAETLNRDPDTVVGKLLRFWSWITEETEDGNAPGVTFAFLDRYVGVPGFSKALAKEGWLKHDADHLVVPDFDKYLSRSAIGRIQSGFRVEKHRRKSVTEKRYKCNAVSTSTSNSTSQDRKGSGKPDLRALAQDAMTSEVLRTDEFAAVWYTWTVHRVEIGKRLTPTSVKQQIKKLEAMGHDRAIAAIEHSIASGYTGIYEDNQRQAAGGGQRASPKAAARAKPTAADRGEYAESDDPLPGLS